MGASRIAELSRLITTNTALIDAHLTSKGSPSLSFEPGQALNTLCDVLIATFRQIVLEAIDELYALILGSIGILTSPTVGHLVFAPKSMAQHCFDIVSLLWQCS